MINASKQECSICGGLEFSSKSVLWPELIADWQLSDSEVAYIDRQQGEACNTCGANLRSIALANVISAFFQKNDSLTRLIELPELASVSILEINEAGALTPYLRKIGQYTYAAYPDVDMHELPYPDGTFDLVVHSDTLEHVPNPVHALSECRRVIKPGGALCFTIPVIVGRMTRGRDGLKKSYHGNSENNRDDFVVHSEFGADAWAYLFEAGFSKIEIHSVAFPAALAFMARR